MAPLLDGKDSGVVATTHVQLLLGCALPVWLSFRSDNPFLPLTGILTTALGDAAAAVWGSRCDRPDCALAAVMMQSGRQTASAGAPAARRWPGSWPPWRCRLARTPR